MRSLGSALCAAALLASMAASAFGDVKYTMTTTMDVGGGQAPSMTMTTSVKGRAERVDMAMSMGPMKMQMTTLTLCDKHQVVDISPGAKAYRVQPITPMSRIMPSAGVGMSKKQHQTGTGQIVSTVNVKDLGSEKIGEFNTHHYAIDMQMQLSGCAGNSTEKFTSEIWVAPGKSPFNCPEATGINQEVNDNGCKITYVWKGDVKLFNEIQNGLTVQRKFTQPNGGPAMMQKITSYSEATLSDSDFQVPSGFQQLSGDAYDQAVQKAMMEQMKQQMQQPGGGE